MSDILGIMWQTSRRLIMFETRPSSEIPFPEAIGGDSRFWSYVKLHLHQPWFFLVINGDEGSQIVLSTQREQWLGLPEVYPDHRIGSIQLVSPGWLNGSSAWKMEPLRQLWTAIDDGSYEAAIYVVEGGARYIECDGSRIEERLHEVTLVFDSIDKKKPRFKKK